MKTPKHSTSVGTRAIVPCVAVDPPREKLPGPNVQSPNLATGVLSYESPKVHQLSYIKLLNGGPKAK